MKTPTAVDSSARHHTRRSYLEEVEEQLDNIRENDEWYGKTEKEE